MIALALGLFGVFALGSGTALAATAAEDQYVESIPNGGGTTTPENVARTLGVGSPDPGATPETKATDEKPKEPTDENSEEGPSGGAGATTGDPGPPANPGTTSFWKTSFSSPLGKAAAAIALLGGAFALFSQSASAGARMPTKAPTPPSAGSGAGPHPG